MLNKIDTANGGDKITKDYMELIPAYGRDYKNKAAVTADFVKGLDFQGDYSIGFAYCSIRDFAPGVSVFLRYKQHRAVTSFTIPANYQP